LRFKSRPLLIPEKKPLIQNTVLFIFGLSEGPKPFKFKTEECLCIVLKVEELQAFGKPNFTIKSLTKVPLSEAKQLIGHLAYPTSIPEMIEVLLADQETVRSQSQEKISVIIKASDFGVICTHTVIV